MTCRKCLDYFEDTLGPVVGAPLFVGARRFPLTKVFVDGLDEIFKGGKGRDAVGKLQSALALSFKGFQSQKGRRGYQPAVVSSQVSVQQLKLAADGRKRRHVILPTR